MKKNNDKETQMLEYLKTKKNQSTQKWNYIINIIFI